MCLLVPTIYKQAVVQYAMLWFLFEKAIFAIFVLDFHSNISLRIEVCFFSLLAMFLCEGVEYKFRCGYALCLHGNPSQKDLQLTK